MKFQLDRKLVLIKIFSNEMSARIAQSFLKASGIEVVVLKDDEGGMAPSLQSTMGVRLLVDQEHAEEALKLLQNVDTSE